MVPSLVAGDRVLVLKPLMGARLFNLFASLQNEQVTIYRTPGFRKMQRNDVIVFNFPHPHRRDEIEMHIMKYYVKRCIGLPGDTLLVSNGHYRVRGFDGPLGNVKSQRKVARRDTASFKKIIYRTFPHNPAINWNIKHFGPLYIPQKRDSLLLNHRHYLLYKKLIEWEQQAKLTYKDSTVYLNGRAISAYRFQKNYCFVAGDHTEDSQDSRYWGLLPEEYIVGKAWIIWKSVHPSTGKFRKERFFKAVK
jgi:signal peptidase I